MNSLKSSKFIVVLIALHSCSPSTRPGTSSGKSAATSANLSSGGVQTSTSTDGSTTSGGSGAGRSVPNFQSGSVGTSFNHTVNKLIVKPAADANKLFLVQRIDAYRPIWLNLTTATQDISGFWKFMSKVSTAVDGSFLGAWSRSSFEINYDAPTSKISVHQPLTTFAESNERAVSAERGDNFKTIGHALSTSLNYPNLPTAVLSLYAIPATDPLSAAIAPPKAYKTTYTRAGPLTADILQACTDVSNSQKNQRAPDAGQLNKCNEVTAGGSAIYDYTNVQLGGTTLTGVGDLNEFFTMQSLYVWNPVPSPGYQCLGQIVTNTPDQPATSADAGGIYAQNQVTLGTNQSGTLQEQADWDYPVYCVAQKYLVPGKLVPLVSNGQVDFYAIAPNDPKGYAKANLFYAVPTSMTDADRQAIKVWVLNTDFVKVLPDLVTAPTTSTATQTK